MVVDDATEAPAADGRTRGATRCRARLTTLVDLCIAHPLAAVFVIAMLVRTIASTVIFVRTGGSLFADDATYSDMATAVVRGQTDSWDAYTRHLYDSVAAFTLPLTLVYTIVGPVLLAGQLLAAAGGSLVAVFATKLASAILPPSRAIFAGLWVALLPSQVLFSSLTLKDAFVWAATAGTAVVAMAFFRSASGWPFARAATYTMLCLVVLAHLRPHTMVIAAWGLAITAGVLAVTKRLGAGRAALALGMTLALPFALGIGVGGAVVLRSAGHLERIRLGNAYYAATAFVQVRPNSAAVDVEAAGQQATQAVAEQKVTVSQAASAQTRYEEAARTVRATTDKVELARAELAAAEQSAASRPGDRAAQVQLAEARPLYDAAAAEYEAARQQAAERAQQFQDAQRIAAAASRAAQEAQASAAKLAAEAATPLYPEEENIAANVTHLPKGISVMLIEPFLWQVGSNNSVRLAAAELVVWYPLVALALLGLGSVRRRPDVLLFPFLIGGGSLLMYALAEGNFGTAYRHRGEFTWVLALLAAFGMSRLLDTRERRPRFSTRWTDTRLNRRG